MTDSKNKKKKMSVGEILFHIALALTMLSVLALAISFGLQASKVVLAVFLGLTLLFGIGTGFIGYDVRFKKAWNKDKTPAKEYIEPEFLKDKDTDKAEDKDKKDNED